MLTHIVVHGPPSVRRWTCHEWKPEVSTWSLTSAPVQLTVTFFVAPVEPAVTVGVFVVDLAPVRSGPLM